MMSQKHFLALLGFAFVAAWIAFNFGYAVLCLVGAGVFYGVAAIVEGELDLGELQQRLRTGAAPGSPPPPVAQYPPPPPAPRVR